MKVTTRLSFFRYMLTCYEQAKYMGTTFRLPYSMCNAGFCLWLKMLQGYGAEDYYLAELKKDLLHVPNKEDDFWYPIMRETYDIEKSLTPRIAHLKRTIARLEKQK